MFFIMLSYFYCDSSVFFCCSFFNQNNPTAVWLRLIGMHNEKNIISEIYIELKMKIKSKI